jgi:hypothetical protein
MNTKKMSLKLLVGWISIYVIAAVTSFLFERGILERGVITEARTIYIMLTVGVLVTLAIIPLSLRGFKRMVDRLDEKEYPESKIQKIYMTCSWLRIAAFFAVVEFGVLYYYLIDDSIGIDLAAIGAICSLFAFPTKNGVEHETGFY